MQGCVSFMMIKSTDTDTVIAKKEALSLADCRVRLAGHYQQTLGLNLKDLLHSEPSRQERYSLKVNGLLLDYSKNYLLNGSFDELVNLAHAAGVKSAIKGLFTGELVNFTEDKPALHTALRNLSGEPVFVDGHDVMPQVRSVLEQMRGFTHRVSSAELTGLTGKPFTDVVNIGIGGSDLGPLMMCQALKPYAITGLKTHFVSNVDGFLVSDILASLNPEATLFIVSSKSFTTGETLLNANTARRWLVNSLGNEAAVQAHFVAVTSASEKALQFGIAANNTFEFWDWVGGRYSLWSAIGLPIMLSVGIEHFDQLLAGAHNMDCHFREAPLEQNMPVVMALLGVWYADFCGAQSHAVLPYDQRLNRFTAFLQQLEMESNGKRVNSAGEVVNYSTSPVVWGESGTNGQHAFFQALHQGTQIIPADFLVALEPSHELKEHHDALVANCFAQSEALMKGKSAQEVRKELQGKGLPAHEVERLTPHMVMPGNKPSNTLVMDVLDPHTLGCLIALYEHKVFVQGVIWKINSFDQYGVELGKTLAKNILADFEQSESVNAHDASTNALINLYKKHRRES